MNGAEQIQRAEEYLYQNRHILGIPTSDGKVQIIQLITTDPADYLKPEFSPGTIVNAKKL